MIARLSMSVRLAAAAKAITFTAIRYGHTADVNVAIKQMISDSALETHISGDTARSFIGQKP